MLTIIGLAWQGACDRLWLASLIFSALTEQVTEQGLIRAVRLVYGHRLEQCSALVRRRY